MKIFSRCKSITYKHAQKKTPAKAFILSENFGGFRSFQQKTRTRKYAKSTRNLREKNHQPPVHDVSLLHCIVADSVTVVR